MFVNPRTLETDPDKLEEIEKASVRLVTQAVVDFRGTAAELFANERDLPQDFGEDVTREALDEMGVSRIRQRLYGKMDYKRARYVFHPEYAVRQALFVDSKAEKATGRTTATLQTAQTSLRIRHVRAGLPVDEPGALFPVLDTENGPFLTTTIFVKYNYRDAAGASAHHLDSITVAAVPHAYLQDRYNPDATDTIWRAGRNAPSRGEAFRVRLVFGRLAAKRRWRVQHVPRSPEPFVWAE